MSASRDQHTHVWLVRHGESAWNTERRIQGQQDPDLSPRGLQQAELVATRLATFSWDALYVSDLTRATRTAAAVSRRVGLPPLPVPGLRERGQGVLEGMLADEAARLHPDLDAPAVGREPGSEFGRRCLHALQTIVARHPSGRVLVVTHGGVIRLLRAHFSTDSAEGADRPPHNCSVSVLDTDGVTAAWSCYDDATHLGVDDLRTEPEDVFLTALLDVGRDVG